MTKITLDGLTPLRMKRCFVKKERNRIENPKMDKEIRFVHFILLGV
ncbi:MAG: hypothetical protein WB511_00275 [Nitrososphaeraceae archaeon]